MRDFINHSPYFWPAFVATWGFGCWFIAWILGGITDVGEGRLDPRDYDREDDDDDC